MSSSSLSSTEVSNRLAGLVGLRAWGAALGIGSFLTLEFGDPLPTLPSARTANRKSPRQHGAWHLWLYCCAWRIDEPAGIVAASEDARDGLLAAVGRLDGATVVAVNIDSQGCALQIEFDAGLTLTTFAIFSTEYEHWFAYLPDGMVVTAGPGFSFSVEKSRAD